MREYAVPSTQYANVRVRDRDYDTRTPNCVLSTWYRAVPQRPFTIRTNIMSLTRLKSTSQPRLSWQGFAFAGTPRPTVRTKPAAKAKPKPAAAKAPRRRRKRLPRAVQRVHPADLGPPEDPVVAALLASNPTTPSEIFHTAQLLLEASRPELAKKYLRKLLDAKLDDGQWSALVDEYPYHGLHRPGGRGPSCVRRTSNCWSKPPWRRRTAACAIRPGMAEEIKQLQDPSSEVRARAIAKLQRAHAAAVEALIAVLADPQRAGEHRGRPRGAGRHARRRDRPAGRNHRTRRCGFWPSRRSGPWPKCAPRRRSFICMCRHWPPRATRTSASRPAQPSCSCRATCPHRSRRPNSSYDLARATTPASSRSAPTFTAA